MFSRLTSIFWRGRDGNHKDASDSSGDLVVGISRKRSFDKADHVGSELSLDDAEDGSASDVARSAKRPRLTGQADSDNGQSGWRRSPASSPGTGSIWEHQNHADQRRLKPPPPVTAKTKRSRKNIKLTPSPQHYNRMVNRVDDDHSPASEHVSSTTPHRLDPNEAFEAERARRRAEAESLGPGSDSGITSAAEHELFIHLSMRGYDPLIPSHWMLDFRTLPLALFADTNRETPLIHAMHGSEFRATKALRDLFDTGKKLRDRIMLNPDSHLEPILRKAVDNYMSWCLKDARLPIHNPSCLPVHRIVMRKRGQKTSDIINELETSLHALAQQHQERRGLFDDGDTIVIPSIEIDDQNLGIDLDVDGDTNMSKAEPSLPLCHPLASLPTLFGILLTHSLVYVFAFDSNAATSSSKNGANRKEGEENDDDYDDNDGYDNDDDEGEEKLSMRYIAKFDFSDSTMDVWNAFSVAIVCMIVRKVLLEQTKKKYTF